MPFPHRSLKSIQPLPSIYTAFPVHNDNAQPSIDSAINSGTCLIRHIEDGIEVVPFERCHSTSAPILSPDQDEKEVFFASQAEVETVEKPLPTLPGNTWQRMSIRKRILTLLFTQFILLVVIGLALLAVKRRSSASDPAPQARTAGTNSTHTNLVLPIQRGMFAVTLQQPQQQSSVCFANLNESIAWQCASDTTFQLSILPSPADENNTTLITLSPLPNNDNLGHEHLIPDLEPTQLTELVNSTSDGQTYHFQSTYNKIIYLKESDLNPGKDSDEQLTTGHPILQPGETLWRCIFNQTSIQGYIYIDQPSTSNINVADPTGNATMATGITNFPYVIKLIEQTSPDTPTPYCEKTTVQEDGSLAPETKKVVLDLEKFVRRRTRLIEPVRFRTRSQGQSADSCRCEWLVK